MRRQYAGARRKRLFEAFFVSSADTEGNAGLLASESG